MNATTAMKVVSPSVEASLSSAIENKVRDVNVTIHVVDPAAADSVEVKAKFMLRKEAK